MYGSTTTVLHSQPSDTYRARLGKKLIKQFLFKMTRNFQRNNMKAINLNLQ
jgi:hypothetical protein